MLHLIIKKAVNQRNVIIDLSAYCQTYQKSWKDVFTSRCLNILKKYCPNTNAVFRKVNKHESEQHALISLLENGGTI